MDRKILFRGKKDNGEWVKGFYFCMENDDGRNAHHFIMPFGIALGLETPRPNIQVIRFATIPPLFEVDPGTVCQYTGLTDKNGRKIFEGDIVDLDGETGFVKFGKYENGFHFGYYIGWPKCPNFRQELGFWNGESKVIGNIFDNICCEELREGELDD